MKILFRIVLLFTCQSILEIILMTLLDKLGIYYLYDTKKALITEIFLRNGLTIFYKFIYLIIPYLILMLIANYAIKRGGVSYLKLATLSIPINFILFIGLWWYFHNNLKDILNPLISTVMASLIIYLIISIGAHSVRGMIKN